MTGHAMIGGGALTGETGGAGMTAIAAVASAVGNGIGASAAVSGRLRAATATMTRIALGVSEEKSVGKKRSGSTSAAASTGEATAAAAAAAAVVVVVMASLRQEMVWPRNGTMWRRQTRLRLLGASESRESTRRGWPAVLALNRRNEVRYKLHCSEIIQHCG